MGERNSESMEYQIISNRGDKTVLCIDDAMTVGDVRGVAGAMLDAPEDRIMTVSLAGKLLTDDDELWGTLRSRLFPNQPQPHPMQRKLFCNITEKPVTELQSGDVMRMFPSKEERKQQQEQERHSTEAMESMVESLSQNPAMLESLLNMNPMIKKMQKKSPEMARMLQDPETLKTILMSSVDPERRRDMEKRAELQLAQISAMPGGQQMINHYMDQMKDDGEEEETENERLIRIGTTQPSEAVDSLSAPDPEKEANNDPLPNPWAAPPAASSAPAMFTAGAPGMPFANPFANPFAFPPASATAAPPTAPTGAAAAASPFGGGGQDPATMQAMWQLMMQSMGSPNADPAQHTTDAASSALVTTAASSLPAQESASTPAVAPPLSEEVLHTGIAALRDMGFENESLCRQALQASGGDVEAAVDFIAEHQDD